MNGNFYSAKFSAPATFSAACIKYTQVDGILADLGVSSHQFDEAEQRIFHSV